MKAVIMAGGRGTRISSLFRDIPKPMIKIGNRPVLEHEIECLRNQGITDIIITTGYLGGMIMNYFKDGSGVSPVTLKPFGVHIEYYYEERPLGNGGALFKIKERLTEDFLLLNGDALFDVDFKRFADYHKRKGGLATLFTHPNDHPYDSGLIITDSGNAVIKWLGKEDNRDFYYKNRTNAGLHIISPRLLHIEPAAEKIDLDREVLKPLAGTGNMFAYDSPEYVKDMGTPQRYEDVQRDFQEGKVKARNLKNRQKAVFLDRDGTINRYAGFLTHINQLELLPDAAKAIRRINRSGYLAIIVTNQPVIARGQVSMEELENIHNKLETLLGYRGAYVDAIYYCPHHPHKGFEGEQAEYKIECECRKPKPGMLLWAARDYNIDLSASWMAGDSECDVKAGKAAGCHTALLHSSNDYGQDKTCTSLGEFTKELLHL